MTYQPLQSEDLTTKPVGSVNSGGYLVLTPAQQLAVMCKIAAAAHVDQFDAQGDPYILHCQKVMHYVRKFNPEDYERMTGAMGHDLIEDSKTTFQELLEAGMSDRVIDMIRALTNMPGETEDEKMSRILANVDAMLIKAGGDLRHNTDIRRGKGLRQKDFDRLVKYHKRYALIKKKLAEHGIYLY